MGEARRRKWRCGCGAYNKAVDVVCEQCGTEQPFSAAPASRSRCPFDGQALGPNRYCARGGGYPIGSPCPFACPLCGHPLEWSGACFSCHGAPSGSREDWQYPGDRWEFDEMDGTPRGDGKHWLRIVPGPRPVASVADSKLLMRGVLDVVTGRRTEAEVHALIDSTFAAARAAKVTGGAP